MSSWQCRPVSFRFQLGDFTLFRVSLHLQVRAVRLADELQPLQFPGLPAEPLVNRSHGYLIRGLPVAAQLPAIAVLGNYLRYVPLQYQHCYIDLAAPFESYQKKFSSKTRSTINRKIRKYAAHCGGSITWKQFQAPAEMRDFIRLASAVSRKTYQERLLDAGIPGTEEFMRQAEWLAGRDRVRAYILFDKGQPVSYLYCPVDDDVLNYAYLGYDPDYASLSVGTVLQWLAIERLFAEKRFRFFDFTEGQSEHKRLFATHQRQCANVFFIRRTARTRLIVHGHRLMDLISRRLGATLERIGLKARIRRLLRSGR